MEVLDVTTNKGTYYNWPCMDINMLSCDYTNTPDIAEEESSLADLVVTGTNLLTTIQAILKSTESLKSTASEH